MNRLTKRLSAAGYRFFRRMHSNGEQSRNFVLASFHHPESITWRWAIQYNPPAKPFRFRYWFPTLRVYRHNYGGQLSFGWCPVLGMVYIPWQDHMWRNRRTDHRWAQ